MSLQHGEKKVDVSLLKLEHASIVFKSCLTFDLEYIWLHSSTKDSVEIQKVFLDLFFGNE